MHLKLKNGEKLHFPSMDSLLEYSESKKVMKQDFQILDLLEQEPKACVQFKYKGFTISASKILFGMIIVFDVFDNTPLDAVFDFGKFLWKERMA